MPGIHSLFHMAVDVFGHDDRVVDQKPENEDQAEERNHIQADPVNRHEDDAPEHGKRNPQRGQEGDPRSHENPEGNEDDGQPNGAAQAQRVEAIPDEDREVVVHADRHRFGQLASDLFNQGTDRGGDVNGIPGALLDDHEVDGRTPSPATDGGGLFKGFAHRGHVPDGQGGPGRDTPENDALDLRGSGCLSKRPDQDLPAGRLHGPPGHVPVVGRDGGPDIVEAEPVLFESCGVHLDPDLPLAHAENPNGSNASDSAEIISDIFGHVPEHRLVDITGERHRNHRESGLNLADLGFLSLLRQVRDIVQGGPHVTQGPIHIGLGLKFEQDLGPALLRDREELVQPVDFRHLLFDRRRDELLYFFGRGSQECGHDLNRFAGKFGKELPMHPKVGYEPRAQDEQREEVHQDPIADGELDQASHGSSSRVFTIRIGAPSWSRR